MTFEGKSLTLRVNSWFSKSHRRRIDILLHSHDDSVESLHMHITHSHSVWWRGRGGPTDKTDTTTPTTSGTTCSSPEHVTPIPTTPAWSRQAEISASSDPTISIGGIGGNRSLPTSAKPEPIDLRTFVPWLFLRSIEMRTKVRNFSSSAEWWPKRLTEMESQAIGYSSLGFSYNN